MEEVQVLIVDQDLWGGEMTRGHYGGKWECRGLVRGVFDSFETFGSRFIRQVAILRNHRG